MTTPDMACFFRKLCSDAGGRGVLPASSIVRPVLEAWSLSSAIKVSTCKAHQNHKSHNNNLMSVPCLTFFQYCFNIIIRPLSIIFYHGFFRRFPFDIILVIAYMAFIYLLSQITTYVNKQNVTLRSKCHCHTQRRNGGLGPSQSFFG